MGLQIKDLFEFLRTNHPIITALSAFLAIILALISLSERGRNFCRRIWHLVTRYRRRVPRETMRILPITTHGLESAQWWSHASVEGQPAMQVVSRWRVTNLLEDKSVHIHSANIIRPRKARTENCLISVRDPISNTFSNDWSILAGTTTEVIVQFFIRPPMFKEERAFKAKIAFTDQFGNQHKPKKVTVTFLQR